MATLAEYRNAYEGGYREAARHQLDPHVAEAHAWATAVLAYWGFTEPQRPDIISGYRSAAEQADLIRRWNAGQRAGFSGKPAESSWHTAGRAVDVQDHVRGFPWYAYLLTKYTGARDGRAFGDSGHFDWPY